MVRTKRKNNAVSILQCFLFYIKKTFKITFHTYKHSTRNRCDDYRWLLNGHLLCFSLSDGASHVLTYIIFKSFPGNSSSKESGCNGGDPVPIPEAGNSHSEVNGNPLQCSCLENSMDRGAWQAIVHGVTK